MTIPVNPTPAIFLPENAPFTPERVLKALGRVK